MVDIKVTARELHDCGAYYLDTLSQQFLTVRMTAEYEGCNPTGFDGPLLFPLADMMNLLKGTTDQAFNLAQSRMGALGNGLMKAADTYGWGEIAAKEQAERAGKGGPHAV
jgi:hypothetical protein